MGYPERSRQQRRLHGHLSGNKTYKVSQLYVLWSPSVESDGKTLQFPLRPLLIP